jgi:hypothetical protein
MFACLGVAGLVFSFLLLQSDRRHGGKLEQGKNKETELPKTEEALEQR